MKVWISSLLILLPTLSWAEDGANHEFGLSTGSYLITGASQNLPTLGLRYSFKTGSNHAKYLELRGFSSNTGGVSYHMVEGGIRNEFTYDKISALWLLGFDWHWLKSKTSTAFAPKQGWHAGFGINVKMNKNLSFRNDYILRFASGMSLSVNLGFAWLLGGGEE